MGCPWKLTNGHGLVQYTTLSPGIKGFQHVAKSRTRLSYFTLQYVIGELKKLGKTTRPFRYDLNQIPYDYTVEVRNRFKALDLIDRVSEELRMEVHDIVQEAGIKTIPKKKEMQKGKMVA